MVFEYILKQNHIDPASDLIIDQNIDFGSTAAAFSEEKSNYDFTVEFEPGATHILLSLPKRVTLTRIRILFRGSPMRSKKA